jgi:Domain of unknown function (DUF1707)
VEQPSGPPAVRVSDQDRERVAMQLRNACAEGRLTFEELGERLDVVYGARTQAELDQVASDLPATAPGTTRRPTRWSVSVIGGSRHTGRFRVAGPLTSISAIGGLAIDLRDAEVEGDEIVIRSFSLIGGCAVTVPEGADVETSQFAVIGGKDARVAGKPRPGLPRVRVFCFSVIGGLGVRSKPRRLDADRVPDSLELEE